MLGIAVLVLAAYLPALGGAFIWNDADYVTAPGLRSLEGLRRIWFDVGATQQYYPALHTFFWIEHRLWGDAAVGYHVANALLHAGAAGLLALTLGRLRARGAWFAAALFALHPVCVESVAWISEQKNTLSAVFALAGAWSYLRYDESRSWRRYMAATGFFALALLSKTVTATLPGALLVAIWWRDGKLSWRRHGLPLAPWFALGASAGLFSGWVERRFIGANGPDFAFGAARRILIAGRALWFYLEKAIWPHPLVFIYPRWHPNPHEGWQWMFPAAAAGVLAAAWALRRRTRGPLAAVLYFSGMLFPVLGFLNVFAFLFSFVADHFQYLACLGVIVPAAALWAEWRDRGPRMRRLAQSAGFAVLLAFGILTWRQSWNYRDVSGFYESILTGNPTAWMAENNLGVLADERGDVAEAERRYRAALQIRPDYPEAHNNLGNVLSRLGRPIEALAEYREAVALMPGYADARNCLGNALADAGQLPEAEEQLRIAVRLKPDFAPGHFNLGNVYAAEQRAGEALAEYTKALRLRPRYPEAENNLGATYAGNGQFSEAIEHYRRALEMEPAYPEAENNLGVALVRLGRSSEAAIHFRAALRLRPEYEEARVNLRTALRLAGSSDAELSPDSSGPRS